MLWKIPFLVSQNNLSDNFYKHKILEKSDSYLQNIAHVECEHKVTTYELVTQFKE